MTNQFRQPATDPLRPPVTDIRFALRQYARSPGFTALAIITLGLSIGACTAIFSVVNGVLLRPMPYPQSDRLVTVSESDTPEPARNSVAPGNYFSWLEQARSFEQIAAVRTSSYTFSADGGATRIDALRVTANYLSTLRVRPLLGRDFRPEEDTPGAETVVLLSHGFWQRQFGGRTDVVDRTIQLDGQTFTVIGVLPKAIRDADVVTPAAYTPADRRRHGAHYIDVIARLRDGVDQTAAQSEMKVIASQLAREFPESNEGWSIHVTGLLESTVGDVRAVLLALLGAVGFLLLIGCANVANLFLVRASGRTKEMAIRATQGASPARIIRQLLAESLVIALLGGALGMLLAYWGVAGLVALAPDSLPRADEIAVDGGALLFTAAVALATGVFFGLAPALQSVRIDLNATLKDTARGAGGGHRRLRGSLVIAEVAIALVLLVGAGLMIRTFIGLNAVDPGFTTTGTFVAKISLPRAQFPDSAKQYAFVDRTVSALRAIPGVQSVGVAQTLPFSSDDYVLGFYREDLPRPSPGKSTSAFYYSVSPSYFQSMGIRLLRGRLFDDHDVAGAKRVAIIGETMARRRFGDGDPIGKRIHITNGPETWREVVGVVSDTKHYGLTDEAHEQMYEPIAQRPYPFFGLVIRAPNAGLGLAGAVRAAMQKVDPAQPVHGFASLDSMVSRSLARQRFSMWLFTAFSAVALLLAATGIYGVISYSVGQRTNEFGVRMALGAQSVDVLRLVLSGAGKLVGVGLASGLVAALLLTRTLHSMLFGVSPHDPVTFAAIAALLVAVALLASIVPARRAMRVNPVVALRAE